jgi:CHAT domain-containing protein/tetratricopeptide (TPR) repeat protein
VVSRRTNYIWRCSGCDGAQEAPVWRLLDIRERSDVIEQPGPGLAWVVCPQCGTGAQIDAPLLLIRPGNTLPLLLAVPIHELGEPSLAPPSGPVLGQEARTALGGNIEGIAGPMIPLPRLLLPVVLARDVTADAADPDRALEEIFGREMTLTASWYRSFLEIVCDSEQERKLAIALEGLWHVPPQQLASFLDEHPELSSLDAVTTARAALDGVPPDPDDDPVPGQFRSVMRARLTLIAGLADGRPVADAVTDYMAELDRIGGFVNARFEQILTAASASPGPSGIPQLRAALDMAIGLRREDVEAGLCAVLGARLLSQPVTDNASTEEAISLLERALSLIPLDDPHWPEVSGNLSGAYHRRVSGDTVDNWENARNLLKRACDAADRVADPRSWAICQTNYGFLLAERPGGSTADEIGRGIDHIRAGLEERSPERNVVDWAYSLLNLGLLHVRRGADGDNVAAGDCYRRALAHLRPCDDLQLWAALQNNLANLLLASEPPDLGGAETAVRSALAETSGTNDPLTAGRLIWRLAEIEERRTGPLASEPLRLRREALKLLSPLLAPTLHLRIGGELADSYTELRDWPAAADTYTTMLAAFDNLYDVQTSPEGRRTVLALIPRLARWAAYVFARVGRLEQAVEVIERGRARQLSVAVSRDTADLARLAAFDQQLADRYRAGLARYRAALDETDRTLRRVGTENRISAAEHDMRQLLSDIRGIPGFERFLQPMTVADISSAADGHPLIYLVSAPWGSYALTVRSGISGEPVVTGVAVPEVTSTDIVHLVLVGADGAPGLVSAQSAGPWLSRLLPSALRRLNEIEPLMRPVADALAADAGHIAIVIPTGLLGLVPLPAIVVAGQILDDIGEIRLAPSAAVYAACRKRVSQSRPQHLVGVADPDGTLPGSRAELAAICHLFEPGSPTTCAVGPDATRAWVLEHIPAASHLHLGCHGASTTTSTLGGMLWLGGDDRLTIDDLLDGRLINCRLAVASACQSGHYSMTDTPDEFTGLPAGFLQAGAACAVVSLWQVRDDVTGLLMAKFYELLDPTLANSEQQPVTALRQARTWLRELSIKQANDFLRVHSQLSKRPDSRGKPPSAALNTEPCTAPYSSPEYWAAFVAWGY